MCEKCDAFAEWDFRFCFPSNRKMRNLDGNVRAEEGNEVGTDNSVCGALVKPSETSVLLFVIHLYSGDLQRTVGFPLQTGKWSPNAFGVFKCGSHVDACREAPLTYSFCTKASVTSG